MLRLVDDLRLVVDAGRDGTTRDVLEVVRDDVGLGAAMSLLDRTGGGQGSSHLDDLDGLLGVADLHPDPSGFEPWLRSAFRREADPDGVTLSTIHRVKGREWDRVAVFGVSDGHRAAPPGRTTSRRSGGCSTSASPAAATASPCSPTARGRRRSWTSSTARRRAGRPATSAS